MRRKKSLGLAKFRFLFSLFLWKFQWPLACALQYITLFPCLLPCFLNFRKLSDANCTFSWDWRQVQFDRCTSSNSFCVGYTSDLKRWKPILTWKLLWNTVTLSSIEKIIVYSNVWNEYIFSVYVVCNISALMTYFLAYGWNISFSDVCGRTSHHFVFALTTRVLLNYGNDGQFFNLIVCFSASRAWRKHCSLKSCRLRKRKLVHYYVSLRTSLLSAVNMVAL